MYNKEQFLGAGIINDYEDIMPVIDLILYRANINNQGGLFAYDTLLEQKNFTQRMLRSIRKAAAPFCFSKPANGASNRILLSDTLLCSDRYTDLVRRMNEGYPIVGIFQSDNVPVRNILRHDSTSDRISKIDFGRTLCGDQLKTAAFDAFSYFREVMESKERCSAHRLIPLFDSIRSQWQKREVFLISKLRENNVSLFITCNEYNLRDRLIVMACRKAGILTRELAHYSNLILPVDHHESFVKSMYVEDVANNYVDQRCLWNGFEIEYCKKYIDSKMTYMDVGCPEIMEKPGLEKKDVLTIMVPTKTQIYRLTAMNDEKLTLDEHLYKARLFEAVACFARNNNLSVLVRYHPFDDTDSLERDKKVCEQYGFTILGGDRKAFDDAVAESKVVIGYGSTSLVVSACMDCQVYNISEKKYDYCGFPMTTTDIEGLKNIEIQEGYKYSYSCEINIDKLLMA